MLKHKRITPIRLYIGLRDNRRMKMVLTKKSVGLQINDILVTGEIIENVVLEFNIMEMVINMKVAGNRIRGLDKAHIGPMRGRTSTFDDLC